MRSFICVILFLFLCFGLKAQKGIDFQQVLVLSSTTGTAEQFFQEVENITQLSFSYSSSLIDPLEVLSIPSSTISLSDFLEIVSKQLAVEYLEFNNKILLIPLKEENQEFWIDGYVRDATSGEPLIGAAVYNVESNSITETNEFGYYSMKVNSSKTLIRYSYLGFTAELRSSFTKDQSRVNVNMDPAFILPDIVIRPIDSLASIRRVDEDIQASQLMKNPSILGENNILQAIKLLPEIQSGGEVQGNILVQGGGPDQNLILMDGVPIYEVNHLLGLTSVFSNSAVNSVDLQTSGFSPKYSGRLSSVINVKTKNGNKYKHQAKISAGLMGASVHLEGPTNLGKTSYLVSARTSYINSIMEPFVKKYFNVLNTDFRYSDVKIKLHRSINKNSSLSIGAFFGYDFLGFDNQVEVQSANELTKVLTRNSIDWNNAVWNLKYNQIINEKLLYTISASTVNYSLISRSSNTLEIQTPDSTSFNELDVFATSVISDLNLRTDWEYKSTENQAISFGAGVSAHSFSPALISRNIFDPNYEPNFVPEIIATESFIYLEDKIDFTENVRFTGGFNFSRFAVEKTAFNSFQPRLGLDLYLSDATEMNLSYSQMTQFIHLLVNPGTGLPADLWLPSTEKIRPEESTHYNLKLRHRWNEGFISSANLYYKEFKNLIDYTSASPLFNPIITKASFIPIINNTRDWEDRVEIGRGNAYGINVFNSYISSQFRVSASYSFGFSNRQFDNINKGEAFPYKYDRRHDLSIALQYNYKKNWTFNVNWVYGSGQATTFATTQFLSVEGEPILDFTQRNNFRMPDYHRLDLSAAYNKMLTDKIGLTIDMGIYNAYNRLNPYFVYLINDAETNKFQPRQIGLFPILPFLNIQFSYN